MPCTEFYREVMFGKEDFKKVTFCCFLKFNECLEQPVMHIYTVLADENENNS